MTTAPYSMFNDTLQILKKKSIIAIFVPFLLFVFSNKINYGFKRLLALHFCYFYMN